jgi:Lon protease-like protein
MSLMRIRIREGKRFTIFDIDPDTAQHWAAAMQLWADSQKLAAND